MLYIGISMVLHLHTEPEVGLGVVLVSLLSFIGTLTSSVGLAVVEAYR